MRGESTSNLSKTGMIDRRFGYVVSTVTLTRAALGVVRVAFGKVDRAVATRCGDAGEVTVEVDDVVMVGGSSRLSPCANACERCLKIRW